MKNLCRGIGRRRYYFTLALWCGLTVAVHGDEPTLGAVKLFQAGVERLNDAASDGTSEARIHSYELAIEQFRRATELSPEFPQAHAKWSVGLLGIASEKTADPQQHLHYLELAFERFAVAAKCPSVDWDTYGPWVATLIDGVAFLDGNGAQRRLILLEARKACEAGLRVAAFASKRAQLKFYDGAAAQLLAESSTEPAEKREYFKQAIARMKEAAEEETFGGKSAFQAKWGECLVQLGKLTEDRSLLQQAAEHYQIALRLEPGSASINFNLGCVHALLNQPVESIRCLRRTRDLDPSENRRKEIEQNADLNSLRSRPSFKNLLEEQSTRRDAEKLFRAGLAFQKVAEKAKDQDEAFSNLEQAIDQYRLTIKAWPDHAGAQVMWAVCLVQEAADSAAEAQRRVLLQSARDHYAAAMQSPDMYWEMHLTWGAALDGLASRLATNPAERFALLKEAGEAFATARDLAPSSEDAARIDRRLAVCLFVAANLTTDEAETLALLQKVVDRFDAAAKSKTVQPTIQDHELWGTGLAQLGKLKNDRDLLRVALVHFKTVADQDPESVSVKYNLACTYALLGKKDEALDYLRQCIASDREKKYRKKAPTDPDLKALRYMPEFEEICRQR